MSKPETPAGLAGRALLAVLIVARIAVSPSIYPWTGVAWNVAVLLFFGLVLVKKRIGDRKDISWTLAAGIMIYLFYPLCFTMCWSLLHNSAFPPVQHIYNLVAIGNVVLFFLVLHFVGDRPLVPATALVTGVCLSTAFALRQRLGGFEATLAVDGISEYARATLLEARVFGLTFSPDMLAATAAGALPLAATLLWLSRRDGRPAGVLLAAIAIGLLLTALALTRSLGGTLAAAVGLGLWLVTFPPLNRKLRLGLLLAGAGTTVAAVAAVIILRGGHLFNFSDWNNPLVLRLDNWRTALAVWREFPLTGAGPGQYGLAMFAHRSLCGNEAKHVHNLLLETLAETGPVGVLGLVLIIGSFLRAGHLAFWRPGDSGRDPLRLAFFASGAAILAHGLVDFSWQTPEVAAIFWVALAGVGLVNPGSERQFLPLGWEKSAAIILALISVWMGHEAVLMHNRDRALQTAREGKLQEASTITSETDLRMDDELFALRAQAVYQFGWRDAATHTMRVAIEKNPRNPFYYRDLAMWSTDPKERLALMRSAVARYPNSAPLNTLLGRTLMEQGKLAEAEPALRHAASACRDSGDAKTMLGMLYDRQGKPAEAEQWLRRGAETLLPNETRPTRGRILQKFLSGRGAQAPAAPAPPAP